MPFDGNGTFLRVRNWVQDATANIKIRADRHDSEDDNFASGLSQCITKDGQTTITSDLPMAGFRHTFVGNATERNQYASAAQVQDGLLNWGEATGTGSAYSLLLPFSITALTDGQEVNFRAPTANTGTVTLNVNSTGAKALWYKGAALTANLITPGTPVTARYNSTDDKWEISTGSLAQLPAGSVTNAQLADMAANTVKTRADSTSGAPGDTALSTGSLLGRLAGNITSVSILGTVSQTGGTPTGAIIEAGSNANGYWTKWADGTMICRGSGSVDVSNGTTNTFGSTSGISYFGNATVTMPQTFAGTTAGLMNPNAIATNTGMALIAAPTSTTAILVNCRHATNGQTVPFTWSVIGRWF